jgi:hypothetical protein
MSTPLQVYQRVLQLPCDDLRSGLGIKATLDMGLKQVIASVFRPSDGFKVQCAEDEGGQLQATISRGVHNIQLQGRYGQNTLFSGEKKSSFISYTIRAEGTLSASNHAEHAGHPMVKYGRITGAAVLAAAALALFLIAKIKAHNIPIIIIGVLVGGQWLGGKVGQRIAQRLEARAENHSVNKDELETARAVWEHFTSSIAETTSAYPAVR